MKNQKQNEEWKETFDTYFCARCEEIRRNCFHSGTRGLKVFIRKLLQSEKEKARKKGYKEGFGAGKFRPINY